MRIKYLFAGSVVALSILSSLAQAERKIQAGQPIVARLEMGAMTLIVFPESIEGTFAYVDPERYSLEYNGPMMAIQPLVPDVRGRFVVIGSSGKDYLVSYAVASPSDDKIYVLSEQQKPQLAAVIKPLGMPDVMRALRTGQAVPGQGPVDLPPPLIQDQRVSVIGWQAVQAQEMVGFVVSVRNMSEQPLGLDVRYGMNPTPGVQDALVRLSDWVMPPRYTVKGVSADQESLPPGATVQVYFVLERRP